MRRREGKHLPANATGCNLSSRTLTSAVYRVAEISVNKKAPVCRSARNLISRDRAGKKPRVFATRTNRFALRRRNAGLLDSRDASPASDPESRIAGIQMIHHGRSRTTAWLMQSLRPINIRRVSANWKPEPRGGDPRTQRRMISRIKRIFISLEPIDEEFNPALPAGVDDPPSLASLAVSVTVSLHAPRDVRSSRARARARAECVRGEPREKQSVPFTGNVYTDRLQKLPLPSPGRWSPARRAFHVCGRMPARARGYIRRQTLRRCAGLSLPPARVVDPEAGLVLSSSVHRIPRVFDAPPPYDAVAPLNRTKSRAANEPLAAWARVLAPFARFRPARRPRGAALAKPSHPHGKYSAAANRAATFNNRDRLLFNN